MEHRGGAVLATSGLVVANENLGGDYFAYLVSALGGFAVFAGVLGTLGARGENGWCVTDVALGPGWVSVCTPHPSISAGMLCIRVPLICTCNPLIMCAKWRQTVDVR